VRLADALDQGAVATHPLIIGELACANLRNRREVLDLLGRLPRVPVATDVEVLDFIERRRLIGVGIEYADAHLLASVVLAGDVTLWTLDTRLAALRI
jgi:predicted nucleic acid-binding protein